VALVAADAGRVPRLIGWQSVPPGPAEVVFADRRKNGEVEFLPFDELPLRRHEVVLGTRNEIVVDVVPRALVDLRACDATGREDPAARLVVHDGSDIVSGQTSASQRWVSAMPPGDYRVVVTHRTREREHLLRVGRRDLAVRYRP